MAKLVVGCGYLGMRVAERWVREEIGEVYALTRTEERAKLFASKGILALVGDITNAPTLPTFPPIDSVLFAVGFDHRVKNTSIETVFVDGLMSVVSRLPTTVRRLVYISSTGVYGRSDGEWVDEDSPCNPNRAGGKACLEAETRLLRSPFANRAAILRLAGIYGPDRVPRQQEIRAGKPLDAPAHGYLNLIHVDDATEIVLRVFQLPESRFPMLLNVTDGHPIVRADYLSEIARLLGAPPPSFVETPAESHVTQRASADKRVSNRRLLELKVPLRYPTYREGLQAILGKSKPTF